MSYTFRLAPVQEAVFDVLDAHDYFSDITILQEAKGDIANQIDQALGVLTEKDAKIGICCVVYTPLARVKNQNAPGPILDPFTLSVGVIENVTINTGADGTSKPALQVVEMVLRVLHLRQFSACNAALTATGFRLLGDDPLTYQVDFFTKLAIKPENT